MRGKQTGQSADARLCPGSRWQLDDAASVLAGPQGMISSFGVCSVFMAATRSFDPAPHRETDLSAWTSRAGTRRNASGPKPRALALASDLRSSLAVHFSTTGGYWR